MGKSFCSGIKAVYPTTKGTNPQNVILVLEDGPDGIIAQAVGIVRLTFESLKIVAIVFIQTVFRPDP